MFLRINLAGGCSVSASDTADDLAVATRQGRLVLARLALAQAPVSQDELAALLWPDTLPDAWERHLSAVVSKLRRLLNEAGPGDIGISWRSGSYELAGSSIFVDVLDAEGDIDRARKLLDEGELDEASITAAGAVAVLRRPFLPGCEALWAEEQRESLGGALTQGLEVLVEVAVRRADPDGLALAREALALDPYRERSHVQLMRLHLALGERTAAAEAYQRCRTILAELGILPSAEIEELRRNASLPTAGTGEPGATSQKSRSVSTLPIGQTSFVGRRGALDAVTAALGRSRFVTLTGPGGVGKTRLAIEAALRFGAKSSDGPWLCELAQISDPRAVAFAIAASAGVTPQQGTTIEETLVAALSARDPLVVVDNCEHVLHVVAPLVERIVRYCPRVRILATSRERLSADGETVIEVTPLAIPAEASEPETLWDRPVAALELLKDRILNIRPDFHPDVGQRSALAEIARHVDGLPLALELAAARVAGMGAVEVARRMGSRFKLLNRGLRTAAPRHRTLQAAVEWSYDLLDDHEQLVFERLSVFRAGATLTAAEHVCATNEIVRRDDVPHIVTALVDKSLLTVDEHGSQTRFRMLETLREFGLARLADRGEAASIQQAHAHFFRTLAWQAEAGLRGPEEPTWAEVIDAELGNLQAAHAWAISTGRRELAAEISAALFPFAHFRSRTDVNAWADEIADDSPAAGGTHWPRAVAAAADGATMRGDLVRARWLAERAVKIAASSTDARFGWHILAAVELFEGRLEESCAAISHWAGLALRENDHFHATDALGTKAVVRSYAGDTAAAQQSAARAREQAGQSGSPTALAWAEYVTGEVIATTDPQQAVAHLDRAVELADVARTNFVRGVALLSATSLRARHGDLATAAPELARTVALWEGAGNWRQQWVTLRSAVELLTRLDNYAAASTLLGAIDERDGANVFGDDAIRLAALRETLRRRLGPDFESHAAAGAAMDPADVARFAREQLAGCALASGRG